jgi:hypothetical protein
MSLAVWGIILMPWCEAPPMQASPDYTGTDFGRLYTTESAGPDRRCARTSAGIRFRFGLGRYRPERPLLPRRCSSCCESLSSLAI